MRILVTGAAGFIGSAYVRHVLAPPAEDPHPGPPHRDEDGELHRLPSGQRDRAGVAREDAAREQDAVRVGDVYGVGQHCEGRALGIAPEARVKLYAYPRKYHAHQVGAMIRCHHRTTGNATTNAIAAGNDTVLTASASTRTMPPSSSPTARPMEALSFIASWIAV